MFGLFPDSRAGSMQEQLLSRAAVERARRHCKFESRLQRTAPWYGQQQRNALHTQLLHLIHPTLVRPGYM